MNTNIINTNIIKNNYNIDLEINLNYFVIEDCIVDIVKEKLDYISIIPE